MRGSTLRCFAVALALLAIACSRVEAQSTEQIQYIDIPNCPVDGVVFLADDRHAAVNCGLPAGEILIVDTHEKKIAATIRTEMAHFDQTAFAALSDGGVAWYGALQAPDENRLDYELIGQQFGLHRISLTDEGWRSELLVQDALLSLRDRDRGTLEMPQAVVISSAFECALWTDPVNAYQYDLHERQRAVVPIVDQRRRFHSCARDESGDVVVLSSSVPSESERGGYYDLVGVRSFELSKLDRRDATPRLSLVTRGLIEAVAISNRRFLLFSNWPNDQDRRQFRFDNARPDFDTQECGAHAVIVIDFRERSGQCLFISETKVNPLGFVGDSAFSFWAMDQVHQIDFEGGEVRAVGRMPHGPPVGGISATGRSTAWVHYPGRLYFTTSSD